jgi:release factor glutamine methyltransferase
MLADCLSREQLGPGSAVLDLGTGSGLLAVTAALTGARVVAVDVSRRALASVRLNARLNRVAVDGRRGDLFAAVLGERFDVIVSNPPYLPSVGDPPKRGAARAWDAGPTGRLFIDRICSQAHEHLSPGGVLLLLHSSLCREPETTEALKRSGLDTSIVLRHRGPLGDLLSTRAGWMRNQGLLTGQALEEDILVIRARRSPVSASTGEPLVSSV